LSRRLAGAKAGDPNFVRNLMKGLVDIAIELDLVNFDGYFDFVALEGLNDAFHRAQSVPF